MIKNRVSSGLIFGLIILAGVIFSTFTYFGADSFQQEKNLQLTDTQLTLNASPDFVFAEKDNVVSLTATLSCGEENIGKEISFKTDLGVLSKDLVKTDHNCQAEVYLYSTEAGIANVEARYVNVAQEKQVEFAPVSNIGND